MMVVVMMVVVMMVVVMMEKRPSVLVERPLLGGVSTRLILRLVTPDVNI